MTARVFGALVLALLAMASLVIVAPAHAAGGIEGRWCAGDLTAVISGGQITFTNKQSDAVLSFRTQQSVVKGWVRVATRLPNGSASVNGFRRIDQNRLLQYYAGGTKIYRRC